MTQVAAMESVAHAAAEPLSRPQFEDFYNQTASQLRAYIKRVAGNDALADDLLQESYVRLLTAPPLAAPALKSYLYRTATNLVMDYHRAQASRRCWWETASRRAEAEDSRLELSQDVERLFLQIPAEQRALLWLAYVEQNDHGEIAAILGVKQQSVKVLLHRARVKMEDILKANGFEGPNEPGKNDAEDGCRRCRCESPTALRHLVASGIPATVRSRTARPPSHSNCRNPSLCDLLPGRGNCGRGARSSRLDGPCRFGRTDGRWSRPGAAHRLADQLVYKFRRSTLYHKPQSPCKIY